LVARCRPPRHPRPKVMKVATVTVTGNDVTHVRGYRVVWPSHLVVLVLHYISILSTSV
jgi:hypothetical protein